jgi:hypothetical protein
VFGILWLISARYYENPKKYSLIAYDVFGNQNSIDGIRTEFQTKQVATSFQRHYQESFPQYDFSISSELIQTGKRRIFSILNHR